VAEHAHYGTTHATHRLSCPRGARARPMGCPSSRPSRTRTDAGCRLISDGKPRVALGVEAERGAPENDCVHHLYRESDGCGARRRAAGSCPRFRVGPPWP